MSEMLLLNPKMGKVNTVKTGKEKKIKENSEKGKIGTETRAGKMMDEWQGNLAAKAERKAGWWRAKN